MLTTAQSDLRFDAAAVFLGRGAWIVEALDRVVEASHFEQAR
jgi:hypothetical protein